MFQLFLQPDWGPVQPTSCPVLPVLSRHHMMVVMSFVPHPDQKLLPCSVGPVPAWLPDCQAFAEPHII